MSQQAQNQYIKNNILTDRKKNPWLYGDLMPDADKIRAARVKMRLPASYSKNPLQPDKLTMEDIK